MKNTLKRIALAIFASLFVLTSCTQLTDPVTVYSGNEDKNVELLGETTNITINVSSSENIIKFGTASTARTILPSAIDGTATGSVFYIWGTNTITGDTFGPEVIMFDATDSSKTKGTVKKLFSRSAYELNLAYVSAANKTKLDTEKPADSTNPDSGLVIKYASLTANTDVDLRYNEKVYFYLTPNTDGSAQPGSLSLTVKALGWDPTETQYTGYTMATELQNKKDGATVTGSDTILTGDIGSASSVLTSNPDAANYVITSVPAGTYEFVVSFTKNGKTYTTSEDVIILANEPTTGTFDVLDIIEKVPNAPTGFVATYQDPTTNLNDATYYNVALTWVADNIKNENYFELETLELLDSCTETTPASSINSDDSWKTTINNKYLPANVRKVVWSNQSRATKVDNVDTTSLTWAESKDCTIYEDGNLKRNSEQVIMQLPLGTRYFARIRAVNDAGESAWTYLDLDGGTADTPGGYKAFTEDDYYINRFQVRYNLNGGEKKAGDLELNKFYTYDGTEIEIPVAKTSAEATADLTIIKGEDPNEDYWQKWTKTDGTAYTDTSTTPVTNPAYTGYKDLVLVANYDAVSIMDVEMIHPSDFEIKDGAIGIAFKKNTEDETVTESNGKYVVDLTDVNKIVLSFNTAVKYDKIEYEIKQANGTEAPKVYEASLSGTGPYTNETEISITGWKTGKYLITWKAWHSTQGNNPYTNYKLVEIESSATN